MSDVSYLAPSSVYYLGVIYFSRLNSHMNRKIFALSFVQVGIGITDTRINYHEVSVLAPVADWST
jgi:hypothetical protein